ncbi:unnamed protein product [Effrenium voratum]|nr:unnamed protein product [Effrenium voratum]
MSMALEFSETKLDLASIPVNSSSRESVIVTNVSKVPQSINLLMPEYELSTLKATPVCCTLAPQESKRLQIEFKPSQEFVDLLKLPPKEAKPEEAADEDAAEEEDPEAEAEEHRRHLLTDIRMHGGRRWEAEGGTVHSSWRLPICFRPAHLGKQLTNARYEQKPCRVWKIAR